MMKYDLIVNKRALYDFVGNLNEIKYGRERTTANLKDDAQM